MSRDPQKKNRFQVSREVQEEFVNGIAEAMLTLADKAGAWKQGWKSAPRSMPYCPVTGRGYSGGNMVRLLLTGLINEYEDERWMTFNQLQKFQDEHPELKMNIRKGEHGVKLLRPEEIFFICEEGGKWKFLSREELQQLADRKAQGEETPEIQRMLLFSPFTVFNVEQIEGFPQKERPAPQLSEIERNALVENFVACSGIRVEHHNGHPVYRRRADVVKMPYPQNYVRPEEYYDDKLHEFFHATGHKSRESRLQGDSSTLKDYAIEEMRAEMFSILAGAWLDLPLSQTNSAAYIRHWNQRFSGGEAKAVFQAAAEAAKILTLLYQFEKGEQPAAKWFPLKETWPELMEAQRQRDEASKIHFREEPPLVPPMAEHPSEPDSAPSSQAQVTPSVPAETPEDFSDADTLVNKARVILHNPEFLELALKQDPQSAISLAELFDSLSNAIHMEIEEKQRIFAAPPTSLPRAHQMRM